MSVLVVICHSQESDDHGKPEEVIRDYGAVCRRVLPSQNGVEDAPPTTAVDVRITALKVLSLECSQRFGSYLR